MKYLFILLSFLLFSCGTPRQDSRKTIIKLINENGFANEISCDSATMISIKEVDYWINGHKMKAFAESYISVIID